jgi:hypothetical protein
VAAWARLGRSQIALDTRSGAGAGDRAPSVQIGPRDADAACRLVVHSRSARGHLGCCEVGKQWHGRFGDGAPGR